MSMSDEWYSGRSLLGHRSAMWFFAIGSRERGKSFYFLDFCLRQWKESDGLRVFYWLRLSAQEAANLLNNNGVKFVDPELVRKYNLHLYTNADCVYDVERDPKTNKIKKRKLLCHILPIGTFQNQKGCGFFDSEYIKRPGAFYNIVLDEFNREPGTKNTFPIVESLVNQLENLIRSTKDHVRIICIANNTTSCSDLLSAFNFIPYKTGRYKLKSKRCVIDVIPNNEKYIERRKGTVSDILLPDSSNFTNELSIDNTLIIPKKQRLIKANEIIKFRKDKKNWFVLYDDGIISPWNGETCSNRVAMRRYLDENYSEDLVKNVIDLFDSRAFRFRSVITSVRFEAAIAAIRPSR